MASTGNTNTLSAQEIGRAADYVELVFQYQGHVKERAALEEFHRDGKGLARLMSAFGALLFRDHMTVLPDEHADCEAEYVLDALTAVNIRYFQRWCLAGGGAPTAWMAAEFLIECMQEQGDQTHQILCDVRGAARYRHQLTGISA
ncbi:hypothetical protein ACIRO3_34625 [Streptomyces sp. NPDC102278]|uniref:hypothetical protein n=1 Tax=Streptomyces sp. NPDC102278 TaxID=3366152 RepID=UPI003800DBBB